MKIAQPIAKQLGRGLIIFVTITFCAQQLFFFNILNAIAEDQATSTQNQQALDQADAAGPPASSTPDSDQENQIKSTGSDQDILAIASGTEEVNFSPDPDPAPDASSSADVDMSDILAALEQAATTEEMAAIVDFEPGSTTAAEAGSADVDPAPEQASTTTPPGTDNEVSNSNTSETDNSIAASSTSGRNEQNGTDGDASTATGDVAIDAVTENELNSNETGINCDGCLPAGDTLETQIANENGASTTNTVDLAGDSGNNAIADTAGDAAIDTGQTDIENAILNLINTNVVGNGTQLIVNAIGSLVGDIDLSGFGAPATPQQVYGCESADCTTEISNNSSSTLANNVNLVGNSGDNLIASTTGDASIETGDVNITNSLMNIANLNIVGQNWFFAVVNVFGDLVGDIVLPAFIADGPTSATGAGDASQQGARQLLAANTNAADVANNVVLTGNSGLNTASSSSGNQSVETGDVSIKNNILNFINYNVVDNIWTYIRVNVFGFWSGNVLGLPSDYSLFQDSTGVTIYRNSDLEAASNAYDQSLAVSNNNYSSIENNVFIDANSGGNTIENASGTATIRTGNISIKNNIFNFSNANFIGDNWQFSLMNIFGEWDGDLAFGKPDLWIRQTVPTVERLDRGSIHTFTLFYGNAGDGAATDVDLNFAFDGQLLSVSGLDSDYNASGRATRRLDRIPANSQGSINYTVHVNSAIPYGDQQTASQAEISSTEADRDMSNNSQSSSFTVSGGSQPSGTNISDPQYLSANPGGSGQTTAANLAITTSNDANDPVRTGDVINFKIVVTNTGNGILDNVLVTDDLNSSVSPEAVYQDKWDLGTMQPKEEVLIEFSLQVTEQVKSGFYVNHATVQGTDPQRLATLSAFASSRIRIENTSSSAVSQPTASRLNLSKISKQASVTPGGQAKFQILLSNKGTATAENIVIHESLPNGLTFQSNGQTGKNWAIAQLEAGQTIRFEYAIDISSNAKPDTYYIVTTAQAANTPRLTIGSKVIVSPDKAPRRYYASADTSRPTPAEPAGKTAVLPTKIDNQPPEPPLLASEFANDSNRNPWSKWVLAAIFLGFWLAMTIHGIKTSKAAALAAGRRRKRHPLL